MKSVLHDGVVPTTAPYPKLMISTRTLNVYLMSGPEMGTCVHAKNGHLLAITTTTTCLVDYNGEVTLSN